MFKVDRKVGEGAVRRSLMADGHFYPKHPVRTVGG